MTGRCLVADAAIVSYGWWVVKGWLEVLRVEEKDMNKGA